ncbi:MAG TPA: hypothetical protein VE972_14250 [Conexibacter sp.]|nr:hypothetical protein [Conexibacter sp.]
MVRALESLEATRARLQVLFPRMARDVTVVFHRSAPLLDLAHPLVPLERLLTAPAARRYVVGATGATTIHTLAPRTLLARASNVPGSRAMLERAPDVLYARLVVGFNNRRLPPPASPARLRQRVRWAWLVEGAARHFAGQVEHARPAIARRLHEGARPAFPPRLRDAALLGGTVFDLLAREQGPEAAMRLACYLNPAGPETALREAFRGRSLVHTEGAWRSHLARLAGV